MGLSGPKTGQVIERTETRAGRIDSADFLKAPTEAASVSWGRDATMLS
jgi:hypothetical protein